MNLISDNMDTAFYCWWKLCLSLPDNFSPDSAAPLLCAGIILYSPLVHYKGSPGKKVAFIGVGMASHIGVKIGHALGAEVAVPSNSAKKEAQAKKLGASKFIATSNEC